MREGKRSAAVVSRRHSSSDVIVVGGGVVGAAVTYFLAREGMGVTLFERGDLACEASGAAAGMLAPIGEAVPQSKVGAARALLHWGLESLAGFPALCEELKERSGIDPEYEPSGVLRVAMGEAEAAALRTACEAFPGLGLVWMGAEEARAAAPGISPRVCAALWSPKESQVRSPLLTRAYAGAALQLGARVETGVSVRGLLRSGDRIAGVLTTQGAHAAGAVVVCTGALAGELGDWLDGAWSPPIVPVRGQILALEPAPPRLRSIVWGELAYLVPKRDGSLVVGTTEERVGFDRRVTVKGLARLARAAPLLVPELDRAGFLGGWAGLRPGSPDGMPGIGPVPGFESLWVAIGHHRNGILLSLVTGGLVAHSMLGKDLPEDAAAFDPARWSTAEGSTG